MFNSKNKLVANNISTGEPSDSIIVRNIRPSLSRSLNKYFQMKNADTQAVKAERTIRGQYEWSGKVVNLNINQ